MKRIAGISVVIVAIMWAEMWPAGTPRLLAELERDLGFADGQSIHAGSIIRNAGLFSGFLVAGLF